MQIVKNGAVERVLVLLTDDQQNTITGATVEVIIKRLSDGVTSMHAMSELDATYQPGVYYYDFDTTGSDDEYVITINYNDGTTKRNFAEHLKVGDFVTDVLTGIQDIRDDIAEINFNFKKNEKITFYVAQSDNAARNVQAGKYDYEKVEIKAEAATDWENPTDTFFRYYWYAVLGDNNPEKVSGESGL